MSSALRERLESDVKVAMKAGDPVTRDTLRMVLAALKKLDVDLGREVTDEDALAALMNGAKTRQESIDQFGKAGRADLVAKESAELEVIRRYLPKALSEEETRALVAKLVAELGIASKKDLGRLMKELMVRHKGAVDGKLAQRIAGELVP